MDKRRLTLLLDGATLAAMAMILTQNIPFPLERTLAGFWDMRRTFFRVGVTVGWLTALWLACYPAWDRAEKVSGPTLLCGAAQALCALALPWATQWMMQYRRAIVHQVYGGAVLASAVFALLTQYALARANGDSPGLAEASRRCRRGLWAAAAALGLGLLACGVVGSRTAVRLAVAAADVAVIALAWWKK